MCFGIGSQHLGCFGRNTSSYAPTLWPIMNSHKLGPYAQGCDRSCTVTHYTSIQNKEVYATLYLQAKRKHPLHWTWFDFLYHTMCMASNIYSIVWYRKSNVPSIPYATLYLQALIVGLAKYNVAKTSLLNYRPWKWSWRACPRITSRASRWTKVYK